MHLNISIIVEFIMDGANPRQGTVPTFPIQVKADPKILPHSRDMSFHPTPPCNDDTIYIRVRISLVQEILKYPNN